MTTGGAERDTERLARRVAIMIQRIAQGEDPAQFDVAFPTSQRLVINMQVAREIGFSPRWQFLADAEQLHASPTTRSRSRCSGPCAPRSMPTRRWPRAASAWAARSTMCASRAASCCRRCPRRGAHAHRRRSRQPAHPGRGHHQRGTLVQPAHLLRARLGRLLHCQIAGRGAGTEPARRHARTRSPTRPPPT